MRKFGTAAILCGGKSTRMGFDKSKIVVNNRLLIEEIAEKLSILFDDIMLITNDKNKFNTKYRVVEDEIKEVGPCGAIYTALNNSISKYVFIVACDMPFIDMKYIHFLKNKLDSLNSDCLITKRGNYYEPLCSFYSITMKEIFKENINNKKFKIMDTVIMSNAEFTLNEEVEEFVLKEDIFTNLNCSKDLIILNKLVENKNTYINK
ncbi:MAG: molybdenum cofactor guanylyltransferase [Clostridiales bacterium]|nr:molybdenum cofactor guanylyltransferase [Clostridiales bacterium]